MSSSPDNVEQLLTEIRNTILENKKFLQNLEEENDSVEADVENITLPKDSCDDDEFEEL